MYQLPQLLLTYSIINIIKYSIIRRFTTRIVLSVLVRVLCVVYHVFYREADTECKRLDRG